MSFLSSKNATNIDIFHIFTGSVYPRFAVLNSCNVLSLQIWCLHPPTCSFVVTILWGLFRASIAQALPCPFFFPHFPAPLPVAETWDSRQDFCDRRSFVFVRKLCFRGAKRFYRSARWCKCRPAFSHHRPTDNLRCVRGGSVRQPACSRRGCSRRWREGNDRRKSYNSPRWDYDGIAHWRRRNTRRSGREFRSYCHYSWHSIAAR